MVVLTCARTANALSKSGRVIPTGRPPFGASVGFCAIVVRRHVMTSVYSTRCVASFSRHSVSTVPPDRRVTEGI